MATSFRPPQGVRDEAARAVRWIEDGQAGSGFTAVGRARASQLAGGRPVSLEVVRRMASYLARHQADKEGQGWSPGEPGYPSPGRVAWAAWGGDPAVSWTRRIIESEGRALDTRSVMSTQERRFYTTEFEARNVGDEFRIAGHAAVFERHSQDLGGFVERVAPGAFAKTIREADVRALFNHDPNMILARSRGGVGTLRLAEDRQGLSYELNLDRRQSYANDLAIAIERGDITQSSFGFRTISDSWSRTDTGYPLRTLTEVSLNNGDVSPVTYPAYLDADVAARALTHVSTRIGVSATDLLTALRAGRLPGENTHMTATPIVEARDLGYTVLSIAEIANALDVLLDQYEASMAATPMDMTVCSGLYTAIDNLVDDLCMIVGVSDPDEAAEEMADAAETDGEEAAPTPAGVYANQMNSLKLELLAKRHSPA